MRRFLYIVFSAVCLLSCNKSYRIKGTSSISSIDGKTIYLMTFDGNQWRSLDSCEVLHGQFRMNGVTDTTLITTLFIEGQPIMPMILETGKIDITISDIKLKVEGTKLNDSLYNFIAHKHKLDLRAAELERLESQMIMNGYTYNIVEQRIDSAYQELNENMQRLVCNFIGKNYNNALGLCGFSMLCNGLPYPIITPLIQSVIDDAPESFLAHPSIRKFLQAAHENTDQYGVADALY